MMPAVLDRFPIAILRLVGCDAGFQGFVGHLAHRSISPTSNRYLAEPVIGRAGVSPRLAC